MSRTASLRRRLVPAASGNLAVESASEPRGASVAWLNPAFSWLLTILLPVFAIYLALLYPIEESAYDAAAIHIPRSVVFSAARSDGWLLPRWNPEMNAGLGSPAFSFYSPLTYVLLDAMNGAGIPHRLGWRVLVALALGLASAGVFGLALALFGRADLALVAAAAFTYAPVLLEELFERGSPAGMAIALGPWVLWALFRLWQRPSGWRVAAAATAWAGMILVHNLTALIFAPVVALFLGYLALRGGARRLAAPLVALLAGVLLSALHVVPFLWERKYVQLDYANKLDFELPARNPLALADLLARPRVFDVQRANNGLGQTIAPLQIALLMVGLPLAYLLWHRRKRVEAGLLASFTVLGLASVWLQLPAATPVWDALPSLDILQFRWRLLGMLAFATLFVVAYLVAAAPERSQKFLVPCLVCLFVGLQLPSLYPQLMHRNINFPPRPTVSDIRQLARAVGLPGLAGFDEYLPIWRTEPLGIEEAEPSASLLAGNLPAGAGVIRESRQAQGAEVTLATPVATNAVFRILYYPGWQGYLDGHKREILPTAGSGYISMRIPAGQHDVALRYEGTAIQHTGEVASLLTAIILLLVGVLWRSPRGSHGADRVIWLRERWWLVACMVGLITVKATWVDPKTTWLRCTSTADRVCGAQINANAAFVDGPKLRGFSMGSNTVTSGSYLRLSLFWEGSSAYSGHMNSFVHVRNSEAGGPLDPETGSDIWAQEIHEAPGGSLAPGTLYVDDFHLLVPRDVPPGRYHLEIGWYDPVSGEQLDVDPQSLQPPLSVLWRSVLLPSVEVE